MRSFIYYYYAQVNSRLKELSRLIAAAADSVDTHTGGKE